MEIFIFDKIIRILRKDHFMINYVVDGNLLEAPANHYKVITVNTVGVMGKGLAKSASEKFPDLLDCYRSELKNGLDVGKPRFVVANNHKFILFATKMNWRNPSHFSWIENGMINLIQQLEKVDPAVIHMPKLGCGLGGLFWGDVHDVIVDNFKKANPRYELVLYV